MLVKEILLKEARPFIQKYHYSGKVPTGKNIFFGWYDTEGALYAVANYGMGVNAYQAEYLARVTGKGVKLYNLMELKRLCRREPKRHDMPLTKFLSMCHKKLARDYGISFVVSFSDPERNHNGGIYKAANFTHLGKTNPEFHVIGEDGEVRHRRYPYRYSQRHGCTIQEARDILGLSRVKTLPKDRWFLVINNRAK